MIVRIPRTYSTYIGMEASADHQDMLPVQLVGAPPGPLQQLLRPLAAESFVTWDRNEWTGEWRDRPDIQ